MKTLIVALSFFALAYVAHVQPAPSKLLQASDLTYVGAFRMPADQGGTKNYFYGGYSLAYNPTKNTLLANTLSQDVAEFTIPAIRTGATVAALDRAVLVQPFTDVLAGHRNDKGSMSIAGLLPLSDRLIVSAFVYYDANGTATLSHFKTGADFANLGTVVGPVQVGNGQAGFVGGPMTPIPPEWQGPLGGPALTGQCCLAIVSRTSYGPSTSVFDPMQVGSNLPALVPATRVLAYPAAHATLGSWDTGTLFNGATSVSGVVFPGGTRSVLFFGRLGVNFCYGLGTATQALHGTLSPDGVDKYCYDPLDGGKGTHGYPYKPFVWAYDALELAAVKAGTKQPWDVQPYATWEIHTPFETAGSGAIMGAAYDPATRRLFVAGGYQDGLQPLVHVFSVGSSVNVPPPVPVPVVPVNSAVMAVKTCTLTVSDLPPDATGGWKVQYQRSGMSHGSATSAAPYVRAATVNAGSYSVTAVWTKTGQASVTRLAADVTCR